VAQLQFGENNNTFNHLGEIGDELGKAANQKAQFYLPALTMSRRGWQHLTKFLAKPLLRTCLQKID
jgi:hypothetical protein